MTVKELIEKLQELDPETRVMTNGYEGGYEDAEISEVCDVALNVSVAWFYGPHRDLDDTLVKANGADKYQIVKAIIL